MEKSTKFMKTHVWQLRSPSNSIQPKDLSTSKVSANNKTYSQSNGMVINRWLPKCLNLFSLDHHYEPKRCIRSNMAGSLLQNWSYTWIQCIYFSMLRDKRSHLAKALFILHKYLKYIECVLFKKKTCIW